MSNNENNNLCFYCDEKIEEGEKSFFKFFSFKHEKGFNILKKDKLAHANCVSLSAGKEYVEEFSKEYDKDDYFCEDCGKKIENQDHVFIGQYESGKDSSSNVKLYHEDCFKKLSGHDVMKKLDF